MKDNDFDVNEDYFDNDELEEEEEDIFQGLLDDLSEDSIRPYDTYEQYNEVEATEFNSQKDETLVKPLEFDIKSTINADSFDDYSMLAETTLTYPYVVFEAQGKLNTVSGLCSGTLTKGDVQVYFRPSDDKNSLVPVVKIETTPINIRNLIRLAKKNTVFYRHTEDSPERLATPEQFIRFINIDLQDSGEYWNNLVESELQPTETKQQTFFVEDLYS